MITIYKLKNKLKTLLKGKRSLTRQDLIILGIITLVFTLLVFYRIGSSTAPERYYTATAKNRDIVLDFGENTDVSHISIFLGHLDNRTFTVSAYNEDNSMWDLLSGEEKAASVFAWNQINISFRMRYLGLVAMDDVSILNELVITDTNGQTLLPVNAADYPELFDEQDTFAPPKTYYSGTMFDEIYHGRTAYEFIHGLSAYETTHPPLGKIFISLGIRLFGMNPLGWRFIPAVFGILMIPLIYLFGKLLFHNTLAATAVTVLLGVDCMHFTLSRIATIDIIAAFFILLMYFLLFRFFLIDLSKMPGNAYLTLGLCGIAMGMAVAVKWTGIYAGLGLGLLFFWYLINHFPQKILRLIGFCLIFFVLLPAVIYVLSYLPFMAGPSAGSNLLQTAIDNTLYSFSYHADLVATHYYSSPYYEWPWLKMPLLCATDMVTATQASSVSYMGNPAIWWAGIFGVLFAMFRWLVKKDDQAGFLVIAYLAQYLPWFFIGRITFIYHYFPASLFMILMIGYALDLVARWRPWGKRVVYGYLVVAAVVFLLFFPVISGIPFDRDYQFKLRLLKDWILVL